MMSCSYKNKNSIVYYDNSVQIVAHRGDWRNAPENSLLGVENCIEMGIDVVEVDLALSKDSILILMHDKTLDRTTNGTGFVKDWTYDSLKFLKLKNTDGSLSNEGIPTFMELMNVSKDEIEVFVDKGYTLIPLAFDVLETTNTLDQAHFLGAVTGDRYRKDYPEIYKKVNLMPLVLPVDTVTEQLKSYKAICPKYYLFSFENEDSTLLAQVPLMNLNAKLMLSTQRKSYCAGHTDSVSLADPSKGWGWAVDHGFNAICTNYIQEMKLYLEANN